MFEQGGLSIVQPDLSHAGGITECWKIAAMAEAYDVAYTTLPVGTNCPTSLLDSHFTMPLFKSNLWGFTTTRERLN